MVPNTPLSSPPLGFPIAPEGVLIDRDSKPLRIDKAYSWDAPLANNGLMHMVISNAVKGSPYRIDTLMLFMANMAWNANMNSASAHTSTPCPSSTRRWSNSASTETNTRFTS